MNKSFLSGDTIDDILDHGGEIFHAHNEREIHYYIRYPNGYGASIIKIFSCMDKFEVGVLLSVGDDIVRDGHPVYDTDITDDVIGDLTSDDVAMVCWHISRLSSDGSLPYYDKTS